MPYHANDFIRYLTNNLNGAEAVATGNMKKLNIFGTPRDGLFAVCFQNAIAAGTSAVNTLTAGTYPTGGTIAFTLGGQTTAALACASGALTAAAIQAALLGLKNVVLNGVTWPSLPSGSIVVTGGPFFTGGATVVITFASILGMQPVAVTITDASTGGATIALNSGGAGGSTVGVQPTAAITFQGTNDTAGATGWAAIPGAVLNLPSNPGQQNPAAAVAGNRNMRTAMRIETPYAWISASAAVTGITGTGFGPVGIALTDSLEGIN